MIFNYPLQIGDVSISIEGGFRKNCEIRPVYKLFFRNSPPDLHLRLHSGAPVISDAIKVFECPPIWQLYRRNKTAVMKIAHSGDPLARTLVMPVDYKSVDFYFADDSDGCIDPFSGPAMELLILNYLARGFGLILHACGIKRRGRGILFVGESGAGKTTMARKWRQDADTEMLSDDRIIVRKKNGRFRIYGTPWHGDGLFSSPQNVELSEIFFLKHGSTNAVKKFNTASSVVEFLKASFPPYWDAGGMEFAMDFLGDLASSVPCRELSFKPDESIVEFVDNLM